MGNPHKKGRIYFQQQELEKKAERILAMAEEHGLKLCTAESCTGGMLSALLTDIEGLSHVFERGYVVYTDQAKHQCIGVDCAVLEECGAVSEVAAIAMASGVLQASEADIAVAITGYAGPGAEGEEEGLVHFAAVSRNGHFMHRCEHFGAVGRQNIRLASLATALSLLEDVIAKQPRKKEG